MKLEKNAAKFMTCVLLVSCRNERPSQSKGAYQNSGTLPRSQNRSSVRLELEHRKRQIEPVLEPVESARFPVPDCESPCP